MARKQYLPRNALALLSALIGFRGTIHAQGNADTQNTLQVQVRRVVLDVVVTGKLGQPIRGLSREDFTITEEGETQRALSLDVHDLEGSPSFVPPKLPPLPANTFVNVPAAPERGPLYVILYDMVNMEREDQPYARTQMVNFLKSKPAGTRVAILVATDKLRLVQGFTEDPRKLLAGLDAKGPHHVPSIFLYGATSGKGDVQNSVINFSEITQYLAGLPGRKNVIWFASQFPLSFVQNTNRGQIPDLLEEQKIKEIVNTMARNRIAIYPVDVRGVVADEGYIPAPSGSPGAEKPRKTGETAIPNQIEGHDTEGMDRSPIASSYVTENEIAKETGGRAFYGRNDLAASLRDAVKTGGDFYTLTYAPSQDVSGGTMRHIKVTVTKPDCDLAYRHFYYADNTHVLNQAALQRKDAPKGETRGTSMPLSPGLAASMQHGAPLAHDLMFVTHIDAESSPTMATPQQMGELARQPVPSGRFHPGKQPDPLGPVLLQSLIINYKLSDAQLKPDAKGVSLQFAAAAYDRDGVLLSSVVEEATLEDSQRPDRKRQAVHGIQQRILVPMNATSLRVGVEDRLANRLGSMEVPLPLASASTSLLPSDH